MSPAPDLAITAGELAGIRASVNAFLAGTAVILTASYAGDGQGGSIATFSAAGTYSARLAPLSTGGGALAGLAGRPLAEDRWVLTLPSTVSVNNRDRVTYNSVTYEVTEQLDWTPLEIARRVHVERIL